MEVWEQVIPKFSILIGKGKSTTINLMYNESDSGSLTVFKSLESVNLYHVYFKIISNKESISQLTLTDSIIKSMTNTYIYDMHISFDVEDINIIPKQKSSILCDEIIDSTLFHIGIYFNNMKITLQDENNDFGMIGYNITSIENKEVSGIFVKGKVLSISSLKPTSFSCWFNNVNIITISYSFVDIESVILVGDSTWSMGINKVLSSPILIIKSFISIRKSLIISCDNTCSFGGLINTAKNTIRISECWIRIVINDFNSKKLFFGGFIYSITQSSFKIEDSYVFISFTNTQLDYNYVKFGLLINEMGISDYSYINNTVLTVGIYDIISIQFPIYDVYDFTVSQISQYLILSSVYFNENGVVNCIYKSNIGVAMKSISYVESNTNGYKISSKKDYIYYIGIPHYQNDKIIDEEKIFESIDISFVDDSVEYTNKQNIYVKSFIPPYYLENKDYEFEIYLFPKEYKYYDDVLIIESKCESNIQTSLYYPLALYHPKRDNYYNNNKILISFNKLNEFKSLFFIHHSYSCKINGYVKNKLLESINLDIKIQTHDYLPFLILCILQIVITTIVSIMIIYKDNGIELIKRKTDNPNIFLFLSLYYFFQLQ